MPVIGCRFPGVGASDRQGVHHVLKHRLKQCLITTVVLTAGITIPATAQTPSVEVTGGYQAPYDAAIKEWFNPGWSVDVAANITDTWAVVGEVGGAYTSNDDLATDLDLYTVGGGVRWSYRRMPRLVPFAQMVLGLARMGSTAAIADADIRISRTKVMLQPGAGGNIPIGNSWGLVGQVDYRRILLDTDQDGESGVNEIRVFAGLRVGF
jgi:hypothetical protein